jgi:hypothetical protein
MHRRGTEYAENFYFKLSPQRSPRLRGEPSEPFVNFVFFVVRTV